MNPAKGSVSFDEIIQADRKRKQNEALANEIFGRSRQDSDSSSKNTSRKSSQTPSLASRVGVAKRSSSNNNIKTQRNNPFNAPSRPNSAASQIARTNQLASAVSKTRQANVVSPPPRSSLPAAGLSIRGTAGPFVVEASNFAPGTTAADIESALMTVATDSNGSNGLTSCKIMSTQPTVIAELVFSERHIANNVIATFNNQKADGRMLHVYLKRHGPGSAPSAHSRKSEPLFVSDTTPTPNKNDLFGSNNGAGDMEDVEMSTEAPSAYENSREAANQDRRDRDSRRAEPDVQDGSYGFGGTRDEQTTADTIQPEALIPPRDDRSGGGSRRDDDRDRDRDRDHDRDRERRYDDGRDYRRDDRRDDRGLASGGGPYHRQDRPADGYENRGGRSSHYGNGVGGGRGYGGPGRMYSDDVMRGGRGGNGPPRGGGGYRGYR